jgi:hypothetical protein
MIVHCFHGTAFQNLAVLSSGSRYSPSPTLIKHPSPTSLRMRPISPPCVLRRPSFRRKHPLNKVPNSSLTPGAFWLVSLSNLNLTPSRTSYLINAGRKSWRSTAWAARTRAPARKRPKAALASNGVTVQLLIVTTGYGKLYAFTGHQGDIHDHVGAVYDGTEWERGTGASSGT